MSYQSPLHIIKGITEDGFEFNQPNLIRLRKRLLADLNLAGTPTITINGKSFTKDEIIKTFDILINDPDLELHELIYAKKNLIEFLEDESLTCTAQKLQHLYPPEAVRRKLFLLITERMILQFKKSMSKRDFVTAREAVFYFNGLEEDGKQVCYEVVHKNLVGMTNFLIEIREMIIANANDPHLVKKVTPADFKFLADKNFAALLNALPNEFNETIIELLNSIINVMYHYHKQHTYDRKLVARISHMLMNVRQCEEGQYQMIRRNHKAYSQSTSAKSTNFRYPGIIAMVVIAVLRMALGAGSCNNSYEHTPYIYPNNFTVSNYHASNQSYLKDTLANIFLDSLVPGEKQAEFENLNEYLKANIHYPEKAIADGKTGTIHIQFIVEPDGLLSGITAIDSLGDGCEEEAMRVIRSMPPWKPATRNGKPVRMKTTLPVKFALQNP